MRVMGMYFLFCLIMISCSNDLLEDLRKNPKLEGQLNVGGRAVYVLGKLDNRGSVGKAGSTVDGSTNGGSPGPVEVTINGSEQGLMDELYNMLLNKTAGYKAKLVDEASQSNMSRNPYNIPFSKIDLRYDDLKRQSDFYAGLGYDVQAINDLSFIFSNLNLEKEMPSDDRSTKGKNDEWMLAYNLLVLVWQVGYYSEKFMSYLDSASLNKFYRDKNKEKLLSISKCFDEFVKVRSHAVETIKKELALLKSLVKREEFLDRMKATLGLVDGYENTIQSVSYEIVSLEGQLLRLKNS
ncbi:hypothetical protein [Borrelia hispanica]|uniref:hypothetical protein n=1 Tax=Borrelia hispanica TaxID=40835 RepID=UPI000467D86D|nr:hypothetical protein [Borrelia hispanica]